MSGKIFESPSERPTFSANRWRQPQKIALEEAITTSVFNPTNTLPETKGGAELPYVDKDYVVDVKNRLSNLELRVQAMDRAGVALTVVSLTMPGIEGIFDAKTAVETARKVNDETHRIYCTGKYADRFRALGCVPMQDPKAAAAEATRCINELGFVGILINGYSQIGDAETVQYLDEPQCEPFWATLEELDVPLYLHPRIPTPGQSRIYRGYEFLAGSPWGFGVETAMHTIRLIVSGLFDRHPRLKIILGHCGEGLPFSLARIDHRLRHFQPQHYKSKLRMQEYWERNFWITTAGVTSDTAFVDTLRSCGEDRLMWSVDYPYEDYDECGTWFEGMEMSQSTRAKIGWENAKRLFKMQ